MLLDVLEDESGVGVGITTMTLVIPIVVMLGVSESESESDCPWVVSNDKLGGDTSSDVVVPLVNCRLTWRG